MGDIKIKRIYDKPAPEDGKRILVDRLWPRGISKDRAKIDHWAKDIAPSHELRKWFNHDADKWAEFKKRYYSQLETKPELLPPVTELINNNNVTLIFSSKESKFNNAAALKEYFENKNK
ncbi:MAG: DUF488 family protein [Candidatus Dadabacteria bacterium]|nr:DUF488 family protein [Candidatus Dadabacteria bacterium]NIS09813.1 DUF488 family protein [Candidatus Dadabacteria bacterium]NIV41169.1 DUF488 family protein [Candidatus Dadabacteria bacterium]NIX16253.1 DUF488 family protein [Candidatus Dadabacteria bacterium]NIY22874.1 DUF488 family protein [Candidatus Dadabacteria bacterium]